MTATRGTALVDAYLYYRMTQRPQMALEMARDDAAHGYKRMPPPPQLPLGRRCPNGQWQTLDSMAPHASSWSRAYYADDWDDFREEGRADEVEGSPVSHRGWFCDEFQDETIAGYVLRLPHGKLIPATRHSGWEGVTLYPLDVYDEVAECARAADQYAERIAETEREYQAAWQCGQDAGRLIEEVRTIRAKIIETCRHARTLRRSEPDAALLDDARDFVQDRLDDIRRLREERDALRDSVPATLIDAYTDGMGVA